LDIQGRLPPHNIAVVRFTALSDEAAAPSKILT